MRQVLFKRRMNSGNGNLAMLKSLTSFPGLWAIVFFQVSGEELFGFGARAAPNTDYGLRRNLFAQHVSSVRKLVLHSVDGDLLDWILGVLPNLRSLDVSLLEATDDDEGRGDYISEAQSNISDLSHLQHLKFRSLAGDTLEMLDLSDCDFDSAVRSLELGLASDNLPSYAFEFISQFAASLESLRIEGLSGTEEAEGEPLDLPSLRTLALKAPFDTVAELLPAFEASSLAHIEINVDKSSLATGASSLTADMVQSLFDVMMASHQQTLKTLTLEDSSSGHYLEPAAMDVARTLSLAYNITLHTPDLRDAILHRSSAASIATITAADRPAATRQRCSAIKEALQFGLEQVEQIEHSGNLEDAESWLDSVVPLKARMLRLKDQVVGGGDRRAEGRARSQRGGEDTGSFAIGKKCRCCTQVLRVRLARLENEPAPRIRLGSRRSSAALLSRLAITQTQANAAGMHS